MDNTERINELLKECEKKYNREYHKAYYKKNKLKLREKYYENKDKMMKLKIENFRDFLKKQEIENELIEKLKWFRNIIIYVYYITMSVIEEFKKQLEEEKLSANTIYQYTRYANEYIKQFGNPLDQDEKTIKKNIEKIVVYKKKPKDSEEQANKKMRSGKAQVLKAVIALRKTKGLDTMTLIELYAVVNNEAQIRAVETKQEGDESLPPFLTYNQQVNDLYDTNDPEKIRQYLINKLLISSNCRNQDLVAKIIRTKKEYDRMDADKNYIYVNRNRVDFIRNNYKTANTYGRKTTILSDGKIANAARIVFQHDPDHTLIPKNYWEQNLSRYVMNSTFKLGETNIMKMYLKHFNSLSQAKKISDNRGTALETLQENYNIGN